MTSHLYSKFTSATVILHLHSTEDADKVLQVLNKDLKLEAAKISEEKLQGFFGNEIRRISYKLEGNGADAFAHILFSNLSGEDKKLLAADLDSYVDSHGSFYVRLDKQFLVNERLVLGEEDAVRVKLTFSDRKLSRNLLRDLLLA